MKEPLPDNSPERPNLRTKGTELVEKHSDFVTPISASLDGSPIEYRALTMRSFSGGHRYEILQRQSDGTFLLNKIDTENVAWPVILFESTDIPDPILERLDNAEPVRDHSVRDRNRRLELSLTEELSALSDQAAAAS